MNNTATRTHLPNVEAPLPLIAGELRPWSRGRSVLVHDVAKFYPSERDRWLPGARFEHRSPTRQLAYTLMVERYLPATIIPAKIDLHSRGSRKYNHVTEARSMPEMVVVRILAIEAMR